MRWIYLGNRLQPIFDKCLKLQAWSEGLKEEIGWGYTKFITTSNGDQFVLQEDEQKIHQLVKEANPSLKYLNKTTETGAEIGKKLKSEPDFKASLNLLMKHLVYFYLANENARLIYSNLTCSDKNKKIIEKWRNNPGTFLNDDEAFIKLAEKLGIKSDLLGQMTLKEVNQALNGTMPDTEEIKERANTEWSLVLENREIKLFLEDLSPIKEEIDGDIKGKSVFKINQKIVGEVGRDILVIHMTTPEMVPLIKKMKAVITDEGGILSHAAITCREFKIPGVIGTKIATKVLKNGDRVEIDADSGVVRRLD